MPSLYKRVRRRSGRTLHRIYETGYLPKALVPQRMRSKLDGYISWWDRRLTYNQRGYWSIDPMPSTPELIRYYSSNYWQQMGGARAGVSLRDLGHYTLLKDMLGDYLEEPRTLLNFGSGEGGVSHLFHLLGHRVINVEPSGEVAEYSSDRWLTALSIDRVVEHVDIVYGSHSLEHVPDIYALERDVERLLKPGGFVFWEVPNCLNPANGGTGGEIHPPHTYYLTCSYFASLELEELLNDTFDAFNPHSTRQPPEQASVIRYLGKRGT